MTPQDIRAQLHSQIDNLPDDIVEQIADFTLFLVARRRVAPSYTDWDASQWQNLALEQLFSEDDEVQYSCENISEQR